MADRIHGVESRPPPARAESLPPPARVGSHPLPARAVNRPPQAEVGYQPPREVLSTLPQVGEEWVLVPGPTGTKWPCTEPRVGSLSPQGLPIRSGRRRWGGRPSVRFMTWWMEKTRPRTISPLRPYGPTTPESTHKHWIHRHARYSAWFPSITWPAWSGVPRSPVRYCQENSRTASHHWLTTPLQKIDQVLPTSGSGIIGPGLCEWPYGATG